MRWKLWRTAEGNGTGTENNCGKLRVQLRWDQGRVATRKTPLPSEAAVLVHRQGNRVLALIGARSFAEQRGQKTLKKKIVAREWLTWWTIEIRLEMKPGKGRSHLIDAAWRFFCSQRGLQVVKGVWTRGKVLLVHKGDQRGVYGGFWFHTSIVWIKIQDTEKKYLFYCILTTTLERKEWGQRRQCKRKKSWHLLNTQQVSGLC